MNVFSRYKEKEDPLIFLVENELNKDLSPSPSEL